VVILTSNDVCSSMGGYADAKRRVWQTDGWLQIMNKAQNKIRDAKDDAVIAANAGLEDMPHLVGHAGVRSSLSLSFSVSGCVPHTVQEIGGAFTLDEPRKLNSRCVCFR